MEIKDDNVFVDPPLMRRRKKRHGPVLSAFLRDIVDADLFGDKYFYNFVNRDRQPVDNEFLERGPKQGLRGTNYLDGPTVIGIECVCTTEWEGPSCEQSTLVTNEYVFIISAIASNWFIILFHR